jgi:hypothetical protein
MTVAAAGLSVAWDDYEQHHEEIDQAIRENEHA